MDAERVRLRFTVMGVPQPKGSAQSFGYIPKDSAGHAFINRKGDPLVRVKTMSDNPKNKGWQQLVAEAASVAIQMTLLDPVPFAILDGPVTLTCVFYLPRPAYIRDKVVPHIKRPDADKLTRSVKDALSKVAWRDDGQVNRMVIEKYYAEPQGVPRAEITVAPSVG